MNIFLGQVHVAIIGSLDELALIASAIQDMILKSQDYLKIDAELIENCYPYVESLRGLEFINIEKPLSTKITVDRLLKISGDSLNLRTCASAFLFDVNSVSGDHQHLEQITFVDGDPNENVNVLIEIE